MGEQAARCPNCGTSEWEWEENEAAWTPDTWRCRGCEARDRLRRQVAAEAEYAPPGQSDGLQIRLFKEGRS